MVVNSFKAGKKVAKNGTVFFSKINRARPVYVCGQLVYCVGMIFMALSRDKFHKHFLGNNLQSGMIS